MLLEDRHFELEYLFLFNKKIDIFQARSEDVRLVKFLLNKKVLHF